ncbi:MAG: hypothetical protein KDE45_17835 [Caldilineaceae bacterium]|nr:hypothetical protein [Caldilineaceae bacterium]
MTQPQSPVNPVVTIDDEPGIFARYIPVGQEAARLRRRTYWLWYDKQGYITLRLLVLPNNLAASPSNQPGIAWQTLLRQNPHAYAISSSDISPLVDQLIEAARTQSRAINSESIALYLNRQQKRLTDILRQNSSPLFRRKELGSGDGVAATPYRYLLAPGDAGRDLSSELDATSFTGSDPATIVMMQVKHILPIANTEAYADAAQAYRPLRTDHVFRAEQLAAEMEQAARQQGGDAAKTLILPPDIAALLEDSQTVVDLVGTSILYGLLEIQTGGGQPALVAARADAESLADLGVARLLPDGVPLLRADEAWQQRLQAAVDEARMAAAERRFELFNSVRRDLAPALLALPSGQGQEVGIVLAATIQRERSRKS